MLASFGRFTVQQIITNFRNVNTCNDHHLLHNNTALVKPTYSKLKPPKARSVFLRHCSSLSANDGRVIGQSGIRALSRGKHEVCSVQHGGQNVKRKIIYYFKEVICVKWARKVKLVLVGLY